MTEKSIGKIAEEHGVPYSLVHAIDARIRRDYDTPTDGKMKVVAMIYLFGDDYRKQELGAKEFYDSMDYSAKVRCERLVHDILSCKPPADADVCPRCGGTKTRRVVAEVDDNEENDVVVTICSKCRATIKRHTPDADVEALVEKICGEVGIYDLRVNKDRVGLFKQNVKQILQGANARLTDDELINRLGFEKADKPQGEDESWDKVPLTYEEAKTMIQNLANNVGELQKKLQSRQIKVSREWFFKLSSAKTYDKQIEMLKEKGMIVEKVDE